MGDTRGYRAVRDDDDLKPQATGPLRDFKQMGISISGLVGYTMGVTKRLVDIDDQLLEEASAVLGAPTMKETVNRALESVILAARRRRHAERLETMSGLDLDNPKVMGGAWR